MGKIKDWLKNLFTPEKEKEELKYDPSNETAIGIYNAYGNGKVEAETAAWVNAMNAEAGNGLPLVTGKDIIALDTAYGINFPDVIAPAPGYVEKNLIITPGYAALNPDSLSYKASVAAYGQKNDTVTATPPKAKKEEKEETDNSAILDAFKNAYGSVTANAESQYKNQLAAIEEQRKYAEQLAEQARQEALKNAYANYDRSLSTYGQNAERLAQIGLSNSGYSDYLTGVAYSNMIGGVQGAHADANEAIERAYYNAQQSKFDAADTYYNRLTDAQNTYQDRLVSLLSGVGSGEIDGTTAQAIANTYSLGDDALTMIGNVANAYKAAAGETEDATDTTDNSAIVDIDTNGATTETIESADSYISGGKDEEGQKIYFHNDIKLIESLGKGNDLTIDEIKTTLEHHLKTGRLSEIDYNNLLKYLEKKTANGDISAEGTKNRFWDDILPLAEYVAASGSPLAKWIGGVAFIGNIINTINGKDAYATIGDNQYRVNIDDSAKIGTEQQTAFNAAAGDSNILKQGEEYYIKVKDKWYKVKSKLTEKAFFDAVNNKISSDTLVTAPTHNQQDY